MARTARRAPTQVGPCDYCEVKLIYPHLATGKKMPPVDYGPDPLGTVAVQHTASGAYIGRWLGRNDQPIPPETRHALHHCPNRPHQHRRGHAPNQRSPQPRGPRRPGPAIQQTLDLGTHT